MASHNMGFTYRPKIPAVMDGRCTQTIRAMRKRPIREGDFLNLFTWSGKPYRSKWAWRKKVEVKAVYDIEVRKEGIRWFGWRNGKTDKTDWLFLFWESENMDRLAKADFIDPPTGEGLRDVLRGLHGELNGEYQIIRW